MKPIPLFHLPGYVTFSSHWWKEWFFYILTGWVRDLKTFWLRGRYGWSPRDTWSLDMYLAQVYAGSLKHLAKYSHGAPNGYPHKTDMKKWDIPTDFEKWDADLLRWSQSFQEYAETDYDTQSFTEEDRRRKAIHDALKEMEPWFDGLWD